MLRKRYYILFVARDDDGDQKIPLPLRYAYGFHWRRIGGSLHASWDGRI